MHLEAIGIIPQLLYQEVKLTLLLSCFKFFATERIIILGMCFYEMTD